MKMLISAFCGVVVLLTGCDSPRSDPSGGLAAAQNAPHKDAVVIDVRTPEEFARDHVKGAINVPVDVLQTRIEEVVPNKSTPIIVHCQTGRRAKIATEILAAKGYRVQNAGSLANAKAMVEQ